MNKNKTFKSINPATEEVLGEFEYASREKAFDCLYSCQEAYKSWKQTSMSQRVTVTKKLAEVLRAQKNELARAATLEMGKPITESLSEVEKCAWTTDFLADNATKWLEPQPVQADGEHMITYQPLGVVLAIMPWNFPYWQLIRCAVPAILAGNTVLLKHAIQVPKCGELLEKCFRDAGFPTGVMTDCKLDHIVAAELIATPEIVGVSLTGSTRAGKQIGAIAGANLKKMVMELGGTDPFVVLEDADLAQAAKVAAQSRLLNNGQSCIAAKRLLVAQTILPQFLELLGQEFKKYIPGDPLKPETLVGPVVTKQALETLETQLEDARSKGAKILTGGKRTGSRGYFFEPTLVSGLTPEMQLYKEEVFGPIFPIISFTSKEEAIKIANETEYGLGASVWTKNLAEGKKLVEQLDCGVGFVNSMVKSDARLPFGGIKQSGLGRELGRHGLHEFTNIKTINCYKPA